MRSRRTVLYVAGLLAAAALPVVAARMRPLADHRCERDGVALDGPPPVRVVDASGRSHAFCSADCADAWRVASALPGARVVVRDETTGEDLDAAVAWYVRSRVGGGIFGRSSGGTRQDVHAFARREDADAHARSFGGVLLDGRDRPFAVPAADDDAARGGGADPRR